jgi:hypothetical protein
MLRGPDCLSGSQTTAEIDSLNTITRRPPRTSARQREHPDDVLDAFLFDETGSVSVCLQIETPPRDAHRMGRHDRGAKTHRLSRIGTDCQDVADGLTRDKLRAWIAQRFSAKRDDQPICPFGRKSTVCLPDFRPISY